MYRICICKQPADASSDRYQPHADMVILLAVGGRCLRSFGQHSPAESRLQCSGLFTRQPVSASCIGKVSTHTWHAKDAQADNTRRTASRHHEWATVFWPKLQPDAIHCMQYGAAHAGPGCLSTMDQEPCCTSPILQGNHAQARTLKRACSANLLLLGLCLV